MDTVKLRAFYVSLSAFSLLAIILLTYVSLNTGVQGGLFQKLLTSGLNNEESFILFELRLPRLLLAFAVGSLFALTGLAYQSLFSNPIASPYTLGVSGGAAVGLVCCRMFFPQVLPFGYEWICSAVGGGAVLFALLPLLFSRSGEYMKTVLLIGVLMSLFTGSLLYFLQFFLDPSGLVELTSWYFGNLGVVGLVVPLCLCGLSLLLFGLLFASAPALDLLLLGADYATSHGVDVKRLRAGFIGLTTLSVAFVVSVVGPIGFVGLIIPHFSRLVGSASHSKLIPLSFFSGGIFLVVADIGAKVLGGSQEIPVGLVTALIGCPLMVLLLLRKGE